VPGLLEWPARFPQPRTVAAACSTSDYFPTVCDALGLPPPDARPIDGVSLLPLIASGAAARPRPLAFETTRLTRGSPRLAWIEDRWKLLTNLNEEEDLLFDLVQDPGETRNLAAACPEESRRMRALLAAWRESCRRSAAGHDYPETR
jgi:arylsulfatase A-like enzyme